MKRIQYKIKHKIHCQYCKCLVVPYVKIIQFRNSKEFICAAHCPKCDRYIENVPKEYIKIKKGLKI